MLDKDVVNLVHYLYYNIKYSRSEIESYFCKPLKSVFDCDKDTTPDYDAKPYLEGNELPAQLREFIRDVDAQLANPPKDNFMFGFPICSQKPRLPNEKRFAFMAMPFREPWISTIAPAVMKVSHNSNFECTSLIDENQPGRIIDQVWDRIRKADTVVADLTDQNPNVFYELGLAHALGKPSIIIIKNGQKVPFDVSKDRFFKYDLLDLTSLENWIGEAFKKVPWRYKFDEEKIKGDTAKNSTC